MTKIDIRSIPEIKTSVGIHGSIQQREVAGPFCVGVALAVVTVVLGQMD